MRVLIVDDEPIARLRLLRLCEQRTGLEVIGQAESGARAIEAIRQGQPDLVVLEVELADMTGFDVLRALDAPVEPATIMVTAHAHHALQAFEFGAIDYLTKHIKPERFAQAIERVQRRRRAISPMLEDLATELQAKLLNAATSVTQTLV